MNAECVLRVLVAAGIVYFFAMGTLMWIEHRQWQRKLEREQKQEIRERLEWYRSNVPSERK